MIIKKDKFKWKIVNSYYINKKLKNYNNRKYKVASKCQTLTQYIKKN